MYELIVPPKLIKQLSKMKKKDPEIYNEFKRKMRRILYDPYHNAHPLHSKYKGIWETHLKNKLILYIIDEATNTVNLVDVINHNIL